MPHPGEHDAALDAPARMRALHRLERLDAPPDPALDRCTALAAEVLHAPIALLTLVDGRRQFFASAQGLPEPWRSRRETPLSHSFCRHVVTARVPLAIGDARHDAVHCDNLAVAELGVVAYLGHPVVGADGEVLGSFAVADARPRAWTTRDAQLLAELAALATRELLRGHLERQTAAVLEEASEAYVALDPEHRLTALNRAAERLLGQPRAALLGRPAWHALPEALVGALLPGVSRALAEHRVVEDEVRVALPSPNGPRDPELRDLEVRVLPWRGGLGVLARDITARKRAEAALRHSEERYALAARATHHAVWEWDLATGAVAWNEEGHAFLGYAPGTLAADIARWREAIHPDERPRVLAGLDALLADPAAREWRDRYRMRRGDGAWVVVDDRGLVTRDAGGRAVRMVGVLEDVTDAHAAAAERERLIAAERGARSEAEQANRAKMEFLATMSHELRTPLNAITGHVQLLELGIHGPVTEAQREALARVQQAQRHLLGLIEDVLDYAKVEAGQVRFDVRAVDVAAVVRDAVPLVEPLCAARGLVLQLRLPEAGPAVWADREKLAQALLNLLSNAAKFTPAPGTITVELTGRAGTPDVAYLRVRDSGIGIPRARQDAIFEPFVQLSTGLARSHGGTGLGLAISRDLVRGMGGDLRVRSAEGEGATFTITLRRVRTDAGESTDRRGTLDRRREPDRRRRADRRGRGEPE